MVQKGVSQEREVPVMFHPLDIFKTEADGQLLWRGAVESFAAAKERIRELAMASPGEYIMLDQNTGHRALLGISGSDPVRIMPDVSVPVGD
jgi:hypothetical protein